MTTFNPLYPRELFLAKLTDEELDSYITITEKLIDAVADVVDEKQLRQYHSDMYALRTERKNRLDPIKVTIRTTGSTVTLAVYSGLHDSEGMKLVLSRSYKMDTNFNYGDLPFGVELFEKSGILSDDQELYDATLYAIRAWIRDLKPETYEYNTSRSYEHQNRAMKYVPGLEYANNH